MRYRKDGTEVTAVCTNDELRDYFKNKGLTYDDITEGDILTLTMLLNKHFKQSNKDGETSVNTMSLSKKIDIKKKSNGTIITCFLYMNSHYFTQRECISFNQDGFIEWCDYLAEEN